MAQQKLSKLESGMVSLTDRITAFRANPTTKSRRPAVIFLHERYGIVQHTKDLVRKLARAGYVALSPDLFSRFEGDRKALERGETRVELRDDEALQDLESAIDYLKSQKGVDATRIAVVGVCQTGRQALLLGAHRRDVSASVVFYGAVGEREWQPNDLRPEPVMSLVDGLSCPVLGVFGEADHIISVDSVLRFRQCLENSRKAYQIKLYAGAPHGWLNDTMPGRYRKEAARDAWNLLLAFLQAIFRDLWNGNRIRWIFDSDISPAYDFGKNVRLE